MWSNYDIHTTPTRPVQAYFEGLLISGFFALRRARAQLESLLSLATHDDFPCMQAVPKETMMKSFRDRLMVRESFRVHLPLSCEKPTKKHGPRIFTRFCLCIATHPTQRLTRPTWTLCIKCGGFFTGRMIPVGAPTTMSFKESAMASPLDWLPRLKGPPSCLRRRSFFVFAFRSYAIAELRCSSPSQVQNRRIATQ